MSLAVRKITGKNFDRVALLLLDAEGNGEKGSEILNECRDCSLYMIEYEKKAVKSGKIIYLYKNKVN